jgi:hypothetical protein
MAYNIITTKFIIDNIIHVKREGMGKRVQSWTRGCGDDAGVRVRVSRGGRANSSMREGGRASVDSHRLSLARSVKCRGGHAQTAEHSFPRWQKARAGWAHADGYVALHDEEDSRCKRKRAPGCASEGQPEREPTRA